MGRILVYFVCICAYISPAYLANVPLVTNVTDHEITDRPKVTEVVVIDEKVELVRQCRCSEKEKCAAKLQEYANSCNTQCSDILKKIGDPEQLKKCITEQKNFGESLGKCIQNKTGKSCYEGTGEPPKIPKLNVTESVDQELNRTVKLAKIFGRNPLLSGLTNVLDTMREYSTCMNQCIKDKREDGDCFPESGCQLKKPSIEELKSVAFQCVTAEDRGQIADTCNCITEAGVTALTPICGILRLFAEKTEGLRTLLSAAKQTASRIQ